MQKIAFLMMGLFCFLCNVSAEVCSDNQEAFVFEAKDAASLADTCTDAQKGLVYEVKEYGSWGDVCKLAEDTVCQLFCYRLTPNFSEPYLAPSRSGGCFGSGSCISSDGYILTNYHVVEGSVAIAVQFPKLGRNRYRVDYVGGCPDYDVALLKLTDESLALIQKTLGLEKLPFITLGDSDAVVNGEKLCSAGYPLGFENIKFTFGVGSGWEEVFGDMLQTTLPINPGNSGGPAFNKKGELIGVTSSGMTKSLTEGLNFIIPSNNIKALLEALLENPIVRSPYWGFSVVDVTPETLKYLGCENDHGALLSRVRKLSLFEKAGLKKGDVLLSLNNLKIDHHGYVKVSEDAHLVTVHNYLSRLAINSDLIISYCRDGKVHNSSVTIEQPPVLAIDDWMHWSQQLPDYDMIGGMVFSQLSMNLVRGFLQHMMSDARLHQGHHIGSIFKYGKLKKRLKSRVCLSHCLPNSQAHRSLNRLLRTCDCIVKKINEKKVRTINDVRKAILEAVDTEHIVVEFEGGIVVALPIKDILREEELLASQYGYEPSNLYKTLVDSRNNAQNEILLEGE